MTTRSQPREKKLVRALIRFDGGSGEAACILRDLSADGAQLLVASTVGIPSEFRLIVGDEPERACFVRRRKELHAEPPRLARSRAGRAMH